MEDDRNLPRLTLWMVAFSPSLWAVHFLLCYLTVAIWCAKWGPLLEPARLLVGVYTLAALASIAAIGWWGWRHHSYGDASLPHDFDTAADRNRFLGFSTVLLSALSFVATLYVGMAALFFETCR